MPQKWFDEEDNYEERIVAKARTKSRKLSREYKDFCNQMQLENVALEQIFPLQNFQI